jgi:signal transduction histidine kinase
MTRGERSRSAFALDLGLVLLFGVAAEWNTWVFDTIAGPLWLLTLLPLLLALPLLWRRTRPLLSATLVTAGLVIQAVASGNSSEGLQNFAIAVAAYSVAAYSDRRRALIGLGVVAAGLTIYSLEDHNIMTGESREVYAGAFYNAVFLVAWLAGSFVRHGRERRTLEAQAEQQRRAAAAAIAEERLRLARELHDIVAHNLSVVVLQAAGARAQGGAVTPGALEKIERSGREALVEMRRLLGVLRGGEVDATVLPQPGIDELAPLVDSVRAAGLPVELSVSGDRSMLTPALELSVYRIVQEALTNALKYAGPALARVDVECDRDGVTIDVSDDGPGVEGAPLPSTGQGLAGMRERVAMFGGDLRTTRGPHGGFAVHASLPLEAGAG